MAATNTTDLDGLFKKIYAPKLQNLIPESAILVKDVPFVEKSKQNGESYNQPVVLTQEQGVTFAASDAGAFTLNASIPMTTKNALVVGSQILLRGSMSYEVAAKANTSTKAFVDATSLMVQNMLESMTRKVEIISLYGQSGIAATTAVAAAGSTGTFTVGIGDWAIGIWAGSEKMQIDLFTGTTLINTTAAVVVTAVNFITRVVSFSCNASDTTAINALTVADVYFYGAQLTGGTFNEMAGMDKIISNTGTLFNIDASVYALWKGNAYSAASGALTVAKVITAMNIPVGLGLMEKAVLYVSPLTWNSLATEITGNRSYDTSYKSDSNSNGTQKIKYFAQNGEIELVSNPCVKQGEAFLFPKSRVKRLGAQDISFKTPGRGDEIFRQLDGQAGFEMRCYTDQAMFIETPARCLKFTNIVN